MKEPLSLDTFERARARAAGNPDLIELIDWVEVQTSIGISPTQAAATWAARKNREPLVRLDDISDILQQPKKEK